MERSTRPKRRSESPREREYDLTTPLWSKYYQEVRKRIRFPRYYKKALNW